MMADGTQIFNIGTPYISGKAKARDYKIDVLIAYTQYYPQTQN